MTYYTLTPSGYVPADPQPVVVPEGYMVVKREPDETMVRAVGYEEAGGVMEEAYRAMTQAGELKPTQPQVDS
jgi:hypothetical protein